MVLEKLWPVVDNLALRIYPRVCAGVTLPVFHSSLTGLKMDLGGRNLSLVLAAAFPCG